MQSTISSAQVRERLEREVADGKTVVLSSHELDDPRLRDRLPEFLEHLARRKAAGIRLGPDIPGYTMLGEIGQGGMSTVFLAHQQNLHRHVAVKVAPAWLGGGERARRMLVQEARAMARLAHPNIVVIHDIVDVENCFAIAMEWVDGRTLTSLLRALPRSPEPGDIERYADALGTPADAREQFEPTIVRHLVRTMRDIALATQAVHDADLLHLDIKPSNVLVRRDGTPLLADFGVTREITPEGSFTRTFAGTPIYAAPEQLRRDDKAFGPHTDVYGLGVTLYEALARRQPLGGLDVTDIVRCVEGGRMPQLSSQVVVPPDLENIVHKAIAPEPEHRYRTAQEFADDLQAFLDNRPVQARPLSTAQRARRWMRNEPWKAVLVVSLAILIPTLAGLGTYLAVQLPTIQAAERQDLSTQARQLSQQGLQRWMTSIGSQGQALELVQRAVSIDPHNHSLASLIELGIDMGWQTADHIIEQHAARIDREPVLRMQRDKVRERRAFFTNAEAEQLSASPDEFARYVLAIERMFRALDERGTQRLTEARSALERAILPSAPDPLLLGFLAYVASVTDDVAYCDTITETLFSLYPDDPTALTWATLANTLISTERATAHADRILAQLPDHAYGYEVKAWLLALNHRQDELAKLREQAHAAGIDSDFLESRVEFSKALGGDREEGLRMLAERRQNLSLLERMRLMEFYDPPAAAAAAEAWISGDDAGPSDLIDSLKCNSTNLALCRRAAHRFFELFPDRRRMHNYLIEILWNHRTDNPRRIMREIADLGYDLSLSFKEFPSNAYFLTRAYMFTRDWDTLYRVANQWKAEGDAPPQATFYEALSLARIGRLQDAARSFNACLAIDPDTDKPKSWYTASLLEDAWLRCSPESDPLLRDVPLATARMQQFEQRNPRLQLPHQGPWTQLIRAEVHWVNGREDEARAALKRGLAMQRVDNQAPTAYREMLQRAAERMKLR